MTVIRGGEIPIEMMLRALGARRVDLAGVETLALLGIAQQIVSAGNFLELVFGRLVAGIEIRVQFLRQFAICRLDIGGRGRRGDAENLVRIFHHLLLRKTMGRTRIIITPSKSGSSPGSSA